MSVVAGGGSEGGDDDKEWNLGELFDKLQTSSEEYDDEDVDKMNISSPEEYDRPTGARSKK